jgi:hypothetical protein
MKKWLAAAAGAVLLLSPVVDAEATDAATLKKYQPNKALSYRFAVTGGAVKSYKLTYKNKAWRASNNMQAVHYTFQNGKLTAVVEADQHIWQLKAPVKVGQIVKTTTFDGRTMKTKVISTNKTLRIQAGTFKSVIVVKNMTTGNTFYLAKHRGIILMKGNGYREELQKVIK